jgi:hypothetical protein
MYLSPPLIVDPISVTLKELSVGGMKLFTSIPIPTRFLFAVVFSAPFAQKIYAEAKILHVSKAPDGYLVGAQFVNIKNEMRKKIEQMSLDYALCEAKRKNEDKNYCVMSCRYKQMCTKDDKPQHERIKNKSAKKTKKIKKHE